jgi:hypothetical protein
MPHRSINEFDVADVAGYPTDVLASNVLVPGGCIRLQDVQKPGAVRLYRDAGGVRTLYGTEECPVG